MSCWNLPAWTAVRSFRCSLKSVSRWHKKTLPVALTKFVTPYQTNYDKMFPAIMIAIIPTIVVYCMFSNQIVDGLTTGAVKG